MNFENLDKILELIIKGDLTGNAARVALAIAKYGNIGCRKVEFYTGIEKRNAAKALSAIKANADLMKILSSIWSDLEVVDLTTPRKPRDGKFNHRGVVDVTTSANFGGGSSNHRGVVDVTTGVVDLTTSANPNDDIENSQIQRGVVDVTTQYKDSSMYVQTIQEQLKKLGMEKVFNQNAAIGIETLLVNSGLSVEVCIGIASQILRRKDKIKNLKMYVQGLIKKAKAGEFNLDDDWKFNSETLPSMKGHQGEAHTNDKVDSELSKQALLSQKRILEQKQKEADEYVASLSDDQRKKAMASILEFFQD